MDGSMRDALKKAFAEKGQELPSESKSIRQQQKGAEKRVSNGHSNKVCASNQSQLKRHIETKEQALEKKKQQAREKLAKERRERERQENMAVASAELQRKSATTAKTKAAPLIQPLDPDYKIVLGKKPTCLIHDEDDGYVYDALKKSGTKEQLHTGTWRDEREVVIGLDFGTSSVKVVIGDKALEKAFAVPFSSCDGIRRYLLPSRLYETDSAFLLTEAEHVYRDLKLSLLANPEDEDTQKRATAFLALVIRHARGWLLSEHRDAYSQTKILWKLVVGLPAAHHQKSEDQKLFHKVAQAAWLAASHKQGVNQWVVVNALSRANELASGTGSSVQVEAEISVVPEIAAQIYGYVVSNRFDRQARNIYLMVDVGAGTVDSSLFRVEYDRGGRKKFTFFTSQVQPNGVMNLHRHRVQWWGKALHTLQAQNKTDVSVLQESKFSTDRLCSIPDSYTDYFSDIQVLYQEGMDDPDQHFFKKRVVVQVRGQTMWRTWEAKLLTQQDLNGIPMFLCGGGTRMQFYRNLEQEMRNMPGATWLNAMTQLLEVPKGLVAPGLPPREYDRLSVAFGLSFLEVSKIVQATPIPPNTPEVVVWRDNYIDKDQC